MANVTDVPVEKIKTGGHELRMEADEESLFSLAASIRRLGILVPLVCRAAGDNFELIAGHRRLAAALQIGLKTVPVVIGEYDKAQTAEVSLAENLFRQDLSPVETASALKDILDQDIMDLPVLATAMHRSEHWVISMTNLLQWPADILKAVHAGWLSVSAASNLALVTDDSYREFLLKNASESGATARTTAAWLQAFRSMQPAEEALHAEPAPPGAASVPMAPQAPCICCSSVFRTDELSHVPVCVQCIKVIREVGASRE